MTRREDSIEKRNCKHGLFSTMSNQAWWFLKKYYSILKLHDTCYNPRCENRKQITFSPKPFQNEEIGFEKTLKKTIKSTEKMRKVVNKLRLKIASPYVPASVAAKIKNS